MTRTDTPCSPRVLEALAHKLHQHLGIDFPVPRRTELLHRLQLLAREQGVEDLDAWLPTLAFADWDAAQIQALVPAFTVGETYFRRDAEALDWLARHHLGPLLASRRRSGQRSLRLWSAGCCTGEEAYSLLFLLDDLLGGERDAWTLELVASDINRAFLARAEQGTYGANAFRRNESAFRRRYFQAEGRSWRVRPAWRGRIRFIPYNLADGLQPCPVQDADLILCRNVLMYFSPTCTAAVLHRLLASLGRDGLLLLSAVEAGIATQAGFAGSWAGSNYALHRDARLGGSLQNLGSATQVVFQPPAGAQPSGAPGPLPAWSPVLVARERPPRPTVVAPAAIAVPSDEPAATPEQLWLQAQQDRRRGQYQAARDALQGYLDCAGLSPMQRHQACLQMAHCWADQQRLDEAGDWLQRALALEPASAMAYWLQALLAQQRAEHQAALLALQRALYLEPDFILGHFLQARLLHAQGRSGAGDKALRVCRQLLAAQAEDAPLPQGDGLSCAQLLRVCEQLLKEPKPCPSP